MSTAVKERSIEECIHDLHGLDLDRILHVSQKKHSWDPITLREIGREYKRYLELRLRYPTLQIPMSTPIDPLWHEHLLFSRDYMSMCEYIFGYYLHHKPCESEEERKELNSSYETNTLGLYKKHFGDPTPKYWPKDGVVCLG